MLTQLTIHHFAIVKSLDLEWKSGMTTITGETGAGKSIAIDALGLCLGDRATNQCVRPGCDKANIVAVFDVSKNHQAKTWLSNQALDDNNECILRRVITKDGRSSAFINGSKVPLAQLKELGALLINIHGQHDHQLIVKPQHQLRLLDEYAGHADLIADVKYQYNQLQQIIHQRNELQQNQQQRIAQQQLLQYQVSELDEFAIAENEFEQLEQDYQKLSHSQQLAQDSQKIAYELGENEPVNVLDTLRTHCDMLTELQGYDAKLSPIQETLSTAMIQLEDAFTELNHYHQKLDIDPEHFSFIEQRYSQTIQLAKKHQVAPENLYQHHQKLKQELAVLSTDEQQISQLNTLISEVSEQYLQRAEQLSSSRQKAAKSLSKQITNSMHELNMEHGKFLVKVNKKPTEINHFTALGLDSAEFLVSMNPGQPLDNMQKVASGGELSRIGLAIQVILSQKVVTPTLIFDEVDVGISGPTAAKVGKLLQQLGSNTQVICVTHLPQVAAQGNNQFFVNKLTDGNQTETSVTELNEQNRVREIARLLAGNSITETSLANARELLAS